MPRGRGRGWFSRGFGWRGNPYLFCRRFPWLPRWWWAYPTYPTYPAYPAYGVPYYRAAWFPPYPTYAYPQYGYRTYR